MHTLHTEVLQTLEIVTVTEHQWHSDKMALSFSEGGDFKNLLLVETARFFKCERDTLSYEKQSCLDHLAMLAEHNDKIRTDSGTQVPIIGKALALMLSGQIIDEQRVWITHGDNVDIGDLPHRLKI